MSEQRTTTVNGEMILLARLKRLRRIPLNDDDQGSRSLARLPRRWWAPGAMPQSEHDFFRALCGFRLPGSAQYCSGDLGFMFRQEDKKPEIDKDNPPSVILIAGNVPQSFSIARAVAEHRGDEGPETDRYFFGHDWLLFQEAGLREESPGLYAVITKPRRDELGRARGAQPLPQGILRAGPRMNGERYGIVGQYPVVPAKIRCPLCNRINNVPLPEG